MRASPAWCALAVAVQFASRPAGARELLAARPADHGPDGGNSSAPSGRGGVHGRPADGAALLLATRRVAEEPLAAEPEAAKPEAAEPEAAEPGTAKPGAAGAGEPGEGTPANTTTTTTTGPAATTSYKAPQLDPGKLLEPESYAPAALGEALGDSLGESVQAATDLNKMLAEGFEDTLFPPGPVSFDECFDNGMRHPGVVFGFAIYVMQFVYNFRTYVPLKPNGEYVNHSRSQETWEHFYFLISIDLVVYGLVDACTNQWAMVGVFYLILLDGCLQLLRTFAVGWVTKNTATTIMHVPEGPQKQRAEADGVGEDIMRWLGAGGAEPGTMLITRRPAMDGTRYTLKIENTYQDFFNPNTHVLWLRFGVQLVLIFWLHVYLVYTQDVFTWAYGFTRDGKHRPLSDEHKHHALPFFLCSFFIQLLAQDFQGRTFFHNLRWWNFMLVEEIELRDGPVTGHAHKPVLSTDIKGRIWFRMFLAFIANYVLQNIVLCMLPLLLAQETSGFDFAKDVFALTYIANLDDCEEKTMTIHHHVAEHHEQNIHGHIHNHPVSLFHTVTKTELPAHAAESPV